MGNIIYCGYVKNNNKQHIIKLSVKQTFIANKFIYEYNTYQDAYTICNRKLVACTLKLPFVYKLDLCKLCRIILWKAILNKDTWTRSLKSTLISVFPSAYIGEELNVLVNDINILVGNINDTGRIKYLENVEESMRWIDEDIGGDIR